MRTAPPPDAGPSGLYVHFPFCSTRCTYCDFPTASGRAERVPDYVSALEREIGLGQVGLSEDVDTVYFGGGTPSLMSAAQVGRILSAVRERFRLASDGEVTLEANPDNLTPGLLDGYRQAGINRIVVGMQTLDDQVLRRAGRVHDGAGSMAGVRRARRAGFDEVGLDLIAGLPGEDLRRWGDTVERAASCGPTHLSVYLLDTDKGSPLARAIRAGREREVDEERSARAYETTVERLARLGHPQYEISNFATSEHESRHNLKYWTDRAYGGFGLGAHAYFGGERRSNRSDLDGYMREVREGRDPVDWIDSWSPEKRLAEALVFGLRLVRGVDPKALGARYGIDVLQRYAEAWVRAREAGILDPGDDRLRLTPGGRLRSNELFSEIM